MKKLKRTASFILKIMLGLVVFLVFYFGVEFILSSITCQGDKGAPRDMYIYLQTNGVHTDLVLPTKNKTLNWNKLIDVNTTKAKDTTAKFVAIGWGDKGFYLETPSWAELKLSTAAKAAFGLSSTAMHCTFYTKLVETEDRKKIFLSYKQYKRLLKFILESFEWTESGETVLVDTKVRYYEYDTFYEATGRYSLFKTCNTWTNQALKHAGLPSAYWAAFESRVMKKYR